MSRATGALPNVPPSFPLFSLYSQVLARDIHLMEKSADGEFSLRGGDFGIAALLLLCGDRFGYGKLVSHGADSDAFRTGLHPHRGRAEDRSPGNDLLCTLTGAAVPGATAT
jgi:hypothetical protein